MRTAKITKLILGIAAALAVPMLASAQQGESHVGKYAGDTGAGKQLYYRYCWGCHGFRGDGNGENGPYLNILPRNFVAATFKCRSTPTGTLPTDEDLFNALTRGFNNSNMPAWITLTAQNRADLVAFIKTFSPRWKSDKPGDPIAVPAEPALSLQSIQHGKELFTKLECWKCHGAEGRGDGPSASTLTDSNDQPIRPYNFAAGSRFKCGATNRDLYKIFMTGVDGTPMPQSGQLPPEVAELAFRQAVNLDSGVDFGSLPVRCRGLLTRGVCRDLRRRRRPASLRLGAG